MATLKELSHCDRPHNAMNRGPFVASFASSASDWADFSHVVPMSHTQLQSFRPAHPPGSQLQDDASPLTTGPQDASGQQGASDSEDSDSVSSEEYDEDEAAPMVADADVVNQVVLGGNFATFDDLKKACEARCSCKLSNNNRMESISRAPQWAKDALPGLTSYLISGTLYCYHPFNENALQQKWARTSCTMRVQYSFRKDLRLHVTHLNVDHNHSHSSPVSYGTSGMKYIKDGAALSVDECSTIKTWLLGRMTTRCVRYNFRKQYPGCDVARRVVRKLRAAVCKADDPHAMDRLLQFLADCEQAGGVGQVKHTNMRISSIVMQHPLMRKVGQCFGKVSTGDGTHNTSKYTDSTLLIQACQDSFGKMAITACSYAEGESEESVTALIEASGLGNVIETWISDNSKASNALVDTKAINHVLCFWHFTRNLTQAMEHVSADRRTSLWDGVLKALSWRGYPAPTLGILVFHSALGTPPMPLYHTTSPLLGKRMVP